MAIEPVDRYRGCLLGLACGDAVGTTVEFSQRGSFAPVTDMIGGGPFDLPAGGFRSRSSEKIAGSGYCVASLEAAMWCFETTETFEDAVLAAANLGDDADTTAAIVGQIAGAHYGVGAIPARWKERLVMGDEIERLADALNKLAPR